MRRAEVRALLIAGETRISCQSKLCLLLLQTTGTGETAGGRSDGLTRVQESRETEKCGRNG